MVTPCNYMKIKVNKLEENSKNNNIREMYKGIVVVLSILILHYNMYYFQFTLQETC